MRYGSLECNDASTFPANSRYFTAILRVREPYLGHTQRSRSLPIARSNRSGETFAHGADGSRLGGSISWTRTRRFGHAFAPASTQTLARVGVLSHCSRASSSFCPLRPCPRFCFFLIPDPTTTVLWLAPRPSTIFTCYVGPSPRVAVTSSADPLSPHSF